MAVVSALPAAGRARGRHAGAGGGWGRCWRHHARGRAPSSSATRTIRRAPTAALKRSAALLSALPEHVHVLLDEALIHFQDVEDINACLRLVDAFPRLLVVRTFSKIYGLSGLRAGYAVSSDARLLAAAAPVLGINALVAGRGGARAPARRRGDRAPPPRRGARAPLPHRPAARARRRRDRQPGQLPLDPHPRPERRRAGERPPQAGRDRRARAARSARTTTSAPPCATSRRRSACCGAIENSWPRSPANAPPAARAPPAVPAGPGPGRRHPGGSSQSRIPRPTLTHPARGSGPHRRPGARRALRPARPE